MPTIRRYQGYRFYFYSHEPNEPPHVHVDRGGMSAKFWIEAVALGRNRGFTARELRQIERMIGDFRGEFLVAWNDYFGSDNG